MAEKDKQDDKPKKPKRPYSLRFAVFMGLVLALVFLPYTILFTVCLIPTIVAAIVDKQQQKTAWVTVGSMNVAGTIPNLFSLSVMDPTVSSAVQLILQPSAILSAFGCAAVGWLLYHNVTPLVAAIILKKNEFRLKDIEKRQKELLRKWGNGISQ